MSNIILAYVLPLLVPASVLVYAYLIYVQTVLNSAKTDESSPRQLHLHDPSPTPQPPPPPQPPSTPDKLITDDYRFLDTGKCLQVLPDYLKQRIQAKAPDSNIRVLWAKVLSVRVRSSDAEDDGKPVDRDDEVAVIIKDIYRDLTDDNFSIFYVRQVYPLVLNIFVSGKNGKALKEGGLKLAIDFDTMDGVELKVRSLQSTWERRTVKETKRGRI